VKRRFVRGFFWPGRVGAFGGNIGCWGLA
jgi:hypothetical protein